LSDAAMPAETGSRRLGTLAAGVTFMYVTNKLFDYLLYPYVVYRAGIIVGGLVMTALSALACLSILRFYDRTKRDWLGIETIRDLKDYRGGRRAARLISRLLSKSDAAAFVALSLYHDPFITTVWLRRERFGGLSARDRRIFWGSVLLGNAFWTVSCWLGVNGAVWAWRWVNGQ
jgi:hypothetical protein